jgi:Sulfatase
MLSKAKFQAFGLLASGVVLGAIVASGGFPMNRSANGSLTAASAVSVTTETPAPAKACCTLGANKELLLAQVDPVSVPPKPEPPAASADLQLAQAGKATVSKKPASGKKPNIVFVMGDDVGWFNIGAYHQGIMSGKTPNLDKLAARGMRFTDYYAEASCTAGRANFITGQLPIRTGLTTVGQAGADVGLPAQACTLATALSARGYATGQFGKNHLGDLNKYLPTVHGFDEFFGYLYHLE